MHLKALRMKDQIVLFESMNLLKSSRQQRAFLIRILKLPIK